MNATTKRLECKRCDHKWFPRLDDQGQSTTPQTCPKCRSKYWQTERRIKKNTTN